MNRKQTGDYVNSFLWDYFIVLSKRGKMSRDYAYHAVVRFFNDVSEAYPGCYMVAVMECSGGRYHAHVLINLGKNGSPKDSREERDIIGAWQRSSGGGHGKAYNNVYIKPYDLKKPGAYYVTKNINYLRTDFWPFNLPDKRTHK